MNDEGEVHRSPLTAEREWRQAHIEALPGAVLWNELTGLNRAMHVFSGNGVELEEHIRRFLTQAGAVRATDLDDQYENELIRLLHNYLASITTLIDAQRNAIKRVWRDPEDPVRKDLERRADAKRTAVFDTGGARFLKDLRNYSTHYALPLPELASTYSWENGGPGVELNTMQLDRDVLLQWDSWSSPAKAFLRTQEAEFDLAPVISRYVREVTIYSKWHWDELNSLNGAAIEEVQQKARECQVWFEHVAHMPSWLRTSEEAPPGWSYRRERAEKRRARYEHGTRGYVAHVVAADGTVTITPDPWLPFPDP